MYTFAIKKIGDMETSNIFDYWRAGSQFRKDHQITHAVEMTAADLFDLAVEYFEFTASRTWLKPTVIHNKHLHSEVVNTKVSTPMTPRTFRLFAGLTERQVDILRARSEEYADVLDTVNDVIFAQLDEGALVGAFNAAYTARLQSSSTKGSTDGESSGNSPIEPIIGIQIL